MHITLKLFAGLTDFLPDGARNNMLVVDLADDQTVAAVIEQFRLPARLVHLVLVNGNYVAPAARSTQILHEGDTLAIWPPIAGG